MTEPAPSAPAVYREEEMTDPSVHLLPGGTAVVFSRSSPDKETPNEDAAAIFPFGADAQVLVVADGLGGQRSGHHASHVALKAIQQSLHDAEKEGLMLRSAILNGFENASKDVMALGVGAATTLVAIEVHDGAVRPYHVGDSVILVTGQRGRIKLQTIAHSPVGFAVEAGILDEDEAMHHEERHLVLNVVGSPEMRIEVGPELRLAPYDTVLLASDGLLDNLSIEEIGSSIRKGDLAAGGKTIAETARSRMKNPQPGQPSKPDDLTLIAYRRRKT